MIYNAYCVPLINSFDKAKRRYESTAPIRGNPDKKRPLGVRRHWRAAAIEMPNPDTVNLMYYDKPLVQWRSDNSFTIYYPAHVSAYVPDQINQYLAHGNFVWLYGRMFLQLSDGKRYLMEGGKEFECHLIDNKMFLLNKPVAYSYRIKRAALAQALKPYESFLDWLQVVLSVQHPTPSDDLDIPYELFVQEAGVKSEKQYDELRSPTDFSRNAIVFEEQRNQRRLPFMARGHYGTNLNFHRPSAQLLHAWVASEDAENWVRAMYVITKQAGNRVRSGAGVYTYAMQLHIDDAREYLRTLGIFLNRDSVLDKVRLDDGATPSRQNTNFFKEINFVL